MPLRKIEKVLSNNLNALKERGLLKGEETVVTTVIEPKGDKGPRYLVEGYEDKEFLRMNSNSYLGISLRKEVIEAEEEAVRKFGVGPGAVRFISGTYKPHVRGRHDIQRCLCHGSGYNNTANLRRYHRNK